MSVSGGMSVVMGARRTRLLAIKRLKSAASVKIIRTNTEKGYQIGSGVIESACKYVVAERCKQAGMRWSKPGINAILFWRCLLKTGLTQLPSLARFETLPTIVL